MKSPNASAYKAVAEPVTLATAPQTQFVRRGFREADALPPPPHCDAETLGTIQRLPLTIQAAFRRKLLAIMALQLGVVSVAMAIMEFASASARQWLNAHIVDSAGLIVVVSLATVALLLLLFVVRNRYPLNYAVLLLFSAAQTLCLVVVDVALDSHAVLFNCVFTCVCVTLMVAMAGWTRGHAHGSWGGLACTWHPVHVNNLEQDTSHSLHGPQLVSPILVGLLAFAPACVVVLLLAVLHPFGIQWSAVHLVISLFAQLVVGYWLVSEVDRMHKERTPDAYMSGVIYLYTDLVAAVAALAMVAAACVCVVATGGDGAASAGGLIGSGNADCCWLCLAGRTATVDEEDY